MQTAQRFELFYAAIRSSCQRSGVRVFRREVSEPLGPAYRICGCERSSLH